jgi:hypothetical protein
MGDPRVAESHLEAVQFFLINPDPAGQEQFSGDESHLFFSLK